MAEISSIKLPSGSTYDIKDAYARTVMIPEVNGKIQYLSSELSTA